MQLDLYRRWVPLPSGAVTVENHTPRVRAGKFTPGQLLDIEKANRKFGGLK